MIQRKIGIYAYKLYNYFCCFFGKLFTIRRRKQTSTKLDHLRIHLRCSCLSDKHPGIERTSDWQKRPVQASHSLWCCLWIKESMATNEKMFSLVGVIVFLLSLFILIWSQISWIPSRYRSQFIFPWVWLLKSFTTGSLRAPPFRTIFCFPWDVQFAVFAYL